MSSISINLLVFDIEVHKFKLFKENHSYDQFLLKLEKIVIK